MRFLRSFSPPVLRALILFLLFGCDSAIDPDRLGEASLEIPRLVAPVNDVRMSVDEEIVFSWTPVEAAVGYEIEILDEQADPVTAGITGATGFVFRLGAAGAYTWRVRAIDRFERKGAWSRSRRLRVAAPVE